MRGSTSPEDIDLAPQPLITLESAVAGRYISKRYIRDYPIPGTLNLLLAACYFSLAFTVLTAASRAHHWALLAAFAVAFAFVGQLGFCLAHEAVHRKFHPNQTLNTAAGVLVFSLFPGSFHFFQVAHLIHHRRNRSDDELEDYVLPGEAAWLTRGVYYLLICGLFWLLLPLSSLLVAFIPLSRIRLPQPKDGDGTFRKFTQFIGSVRPNRVRRDVLTAAVVWGLAFPLLHLRLSAILICYAAFGFSWASQQYIYHVRTPRHAVLGALDLKLWKPVEILYLHFNYHQTHHLAAWVPWNYLPLVAAQEPERKYFRTYLGLWRVPQRVEEAWPAKHQKSGPLPTRPDQPSGIGELPW